LRTLIVDDHQLFSAGLRLLLTGLMPQVQAQCCANGASALERASQEPFDLVLLDWQLGGGISGVELIQRMGELLPAARVVVVSGDANPSTVRAAVEAGAVGFVPKESSPDLMTAALSVALNGGVYLPVLALASPANADRASAATTPGAPLRRIADVFQGLSQRQCEVLSCLARGLPNKTIARQLDIAEGTVKQHVNAVFREMGVNSRTEAVYVLARQGVKLD
jgi:two-component system, NarL family, nitrate/nitrite response regulator NarL